MNVHRNFGEGKPERAEHQPHLVAAVVEFIVMKRQVDHGTRLCNGSTAANRATE